MIVTPKSVSMVMKLYDDIKTRKWSSVMTKSEIITDDERNYEGENEKASEAMESFLQWGKTYRFTVEEIEDE